MYQSTKTFTHELGFSACFRQWRAQSHCKLLHGYALEFKLTFGAQKLDARNWVLDFGNFRQLKNFLEDTFDHKLLVAHNDPYLDELSGLTGLGLAEVVVLESVGCEAFARLVFEKAVELYQNERVKVISCEVKEHGANSAIYTGEGND